MFRKGGRNSEGHWSSQLRQCAPWAACHPANRLLLPRALFKGVLAPSNQQLRETAVVHRANALVLMAAVSTQRWHNARHPHLSSCSLCLRRWQDGRGKFQECNPSDSNALRSVKIICCCSREAVQVGDKLRTWACQPRGLESSSLIGGL